MKRDFKTEVKADSPTSNVGLLIYIIPQLHDFADHAQQVRVRLTYLDNSNNCF